MAKRMQFLYIVITTLPLPQGIRHSFMKLMNVCVGVLIRLPRRIPCPRGLNRWAGAFPSCLAARCAIISPLPLRVTPRWSRAAILRLHFLYNLQVFPPIRSSIKSNQIWTVFFFFRNQCPGCEMHHWSKYPAPDTSCCGSGVVGFSPGPRCHPHHHRLGGL